MTGREFKIKKGAVIYSEGLDDVVLDVQGEQGQLFSVTDRLTGLLHHVADISGIPILEVFSDNRILMGTYGTHAMEINGSNVILPNLPTASSYTGIAVLDGNIVKRVASIGDVGGEPAITSGTVNDYWRGDKTWQNLSAAILNNALTGYTVGTNTALAATDTILGAFGKVQGQINARVSGTIAAGQVAFGTAANTIGGDSGLTWDNVNKRLSSSFFSSRFYEFKDVFNVKNWELSTNGTDGKYIYWKYVVGGVDQRWMYFLPDAGVTGVAGIQFRPFGDHMVTITSVGLRIGGDGTTGTSHRLDVDGEARIRTIANLGAAASEVLVPSATGVVNKRTITEFKSDLGLAGNYVTIDTSQTISGAKTFSNSNNQFRENLKIYSSDSTSTYHSRLILESTESLARANGVYHINTASEDHWWIGTIYPTGHYELRYKSGGTTIDNNIIRSDAGSTSSLVFSIDRTTRNVTFGGSLNATSLIRTGGTASEFLKADGSVDSNSYSLSTSDITAVSLTTTTLTLTRSAGNLTATVPTWNQNTTGNAATATTATTVNGTSGQLFRKDDRIIEPNSINGNHLQFGFTSWNNDNAAPYADYLHLRSYGDSSGGSDNLLMISKSGLGIRLWQHSFGSSTPYATFKDVAWNDGTNSSGTWGISITGSAATLTTARTINGTSFNGSANITTANWGTARTITIGSTGKSVNGSGNIAWSLGEIGAEPAFTKGGLIAGTNISLSGTLTNRLVGTGDVTINASGTDPIYLVNGYYPTLGHYSSSDTGLGDAQQVFYVPYEAPLFWKNNMAITAIRGLAGGGAPVGSLVRIGLYELTGINTLTLVHDFGRMSGEGGGFKEIVVTGTITKGKMYYMVYKRDDAAGGTVFTMGGRTYGHPFIAHNGIASSTSNSASLWKNGIAFGAFPATDTLPASGDHLFSSPLFYLKLANI